MKMQDNNVSSFENIRAAHFDLLSSDTPSEGDIILFLRETKLSGEVIYSFELRHKVQSFINYWVGYGLRNNFNFKGLKTPILLDRAKDEKRPVFDEGNSPYRGLKSFDNPQYFFGREQSTAQLAKIVTQHNITIIHGRSGQGKSSLVEAGLLPELKETNIDIEFIGPVVPGDIAGQATAEIMQKKLPKMGIETIRNQLINPRKVNNILNKYNPTGTVVVIDQFEELFTHTENDTDSAVEIIIRVLEKISAPNKIIIVLRSEFLKRLNDLIPEKTKKGVGYFQIPRMTYHELKRAILGPARLKGLIIEPRVVESVINDVMEERASLPLLQFTLEKLWKIRKKNVIKYNDYLKIGSPNQALQREADKIFNQLSVSEKLVAESVFKNLSTPDGYRLRVPKKKLLEDAYSSAAVSSQFSIDDILQTFIDAELIRISPSETYDVVHEALITNWPQYQIWLGQKLNEKDDALVIEVKAKRWVNSGKPANLLISDVKELELQSKHENHSVEVATFLAASESFSQVNENSRKFKKRVSVFALLSLIGALAVIPIIYNQFEHENNIRQAEKQVQKKTKLELDAALNRISEIGEEIAQLEDINNRWNDKDQINIKRKQVADWIIAQQANIDKLENDVSIASNKVSLNDHTNVKPWTYRPDIDRGKVSLDCRGYIWVGSDETPKAYSNSNEIVSKIKPGDRLTATSSLKLRDSISISADANGYTAGDQKGTVVNYVQVEALGAPAQYWNKAKTVKNYWVEVKAPLKSCYGVYVHYSTDQEFYLAEQTRRYLRDIYGFNVGPVEKVSTWDGHTKTKYHVGKPDMLEVSRELNSAFNEIFKDFTTQPDLQDLQKEYFQTSIPNEPIPDNLKYSPNLEIWIGQMPSQEEIHWTPWYNRDTPGGSGDVEWIKFEGDYCKEPKKIECQIVGKPSVNVSKGICQEDYGSLCENGAEVCEDYEMRIQCPPSN